MNGLSTERRKHKRFPIQRKTDFLVNISNWDDFSQSIWGRTRNISQNGMLVEIPFGKFKEEDFYFFKFFNRDREILSGKFKIVHIFKESKIHGDAIFGVQLLFPSLSFMDQYLDILK